MVRIYVNKDESLDAALKRFKRKIANEGIMLSIREKEYFVSKGEQRRAKKKEAERAASRDAKRNEKYY